MLKHGGDGVEGVRSDTRRRDVADEQIDERRQNLRVQLLLSESQDVMGIEPNCEKETDSHEGCVTVVGSTGLLSSRTCSIGARSEASWPTAWVAAQRTRGCESLSAETAGAMTALRCAGSSGIVSPMDASAMSAPCRACHSSNNNM